VPQDVSASRLLAAATADAVRSSYLAPDLPDTGSLLSHLLELFHSDIESTDLTITMTCVSQGLRASEIHHSEYESLRRVRSSLSALAASIAETSGEISPTIFGKTLTLVEVDAVHRQLNDEAVHFWSTHKYQVPAICGSISISRQPGDLLLKATAIMRTGWAVAVLNSLQRRQAACTPGNPLDLLRLKGQRTRSVHPVLKSFTTPTWRVDPGDLVENGDSELSVSHSDLHMPPLGDDYSFREAMKGLQLAWIFRAVSDDGLMWLRCAAG